MTHSPSKGTKASTYLPVQGDEGVHVHDVAEALRHRFGHAGDDHAPVALPDEDHVLGVLARTAICAECRTWR
jgi:hypothetical protein